MQILAAGAQTSCSAGALVKMTDNDIINSASSLLVHINNAKRLYAEYKHITYAPPRIGPDRSIDQNSLLHLWLTEYAAFLLDKPKKQVTTGELEGMKRTVKARFTQSHPDCKEWMVIEVICPFTGRTKKDYASSRDYKRGEMFVFLTWLQMMGANDGIILESKGKFAKDQREHEDL